MMSVLKGKKMDKKQVQETYRETTLEEEQEYFEEVENELQCDLQTTQESIDYRNQAIKAQKKYMRDSHGDMDDEEFLQNMNNVNNDTFFIEHAAKQVDVLAHQIESPYFGKIAFEYQEDGQVLPVYIGTNGYWSMDEQDQSDIVILRLSQRTASDIRLDMVCPTQHLKRQSLYLQMSRRNSSLHFM